MILYTLFLLVLLVPGAARIGVRHLVLHEIPDAREPPAAAFAEVRLNARVQGAVRYQAVPIGEGARAKQTGVGLLPGVRPLVDLQLALPVETLAAEFAGQVLFRVVDAHVGLAGVVARELLLADAALEEGAPAAVRFVVYLEHRFLFEFLAAFFADVYVLLPRDALVEDVPVRAEGVYVGKDLVTAVMASYDKKKTDIYS